MGISVNNASSVKTNDTQELVSKNNSTSTHTVKNHIDNSFKASSNAKQTSIENRIADQFKSFSGNTVIDNTQTNKDLLSFFTQTRKEFIKYKEDIFSHYKYIQLNNIKLEKAEYYFCYFYKNLVNLKQNLQKADISKKIISNDINSNFNEKNLKKEVNSIISYLDNVIEKLSTNKPTTAKKIRNYLHNIFAYILTKFDSILTYIRGKINLLISIFSPSKKNYIDINKYQIPYNSTVANKPNPIETLEQKSNNKANIDLPPQTEFKSTQTETKPTQAETKITQTESNLTQAEFESPENEIELQKNEPAESNELELKNQGISLSRMDNDCSNTCWFNAAIKLFYRMHHNNINNIIDNYKKITNATFDAELINKRDEFLNSLEILFNLLKENKDVGENSYNFMNNLYFYVIAIKKSMELKSKLLEEELTSNIDDPNILEEVKKDIKKQSSISIPGVGAIEKLFKTNIKSTDGILSLDFSLMQQQVSSEFIFAMIDFLRISNETNALTEVRQVSLCFDNNTDIQNNNQTKIPEIKRDKEECVRDFILNSTIKPRTYDQTEPRLKSVIIKEIDENQRYSDFDIKEANELKRRLKKEIEASSDIEIDVNFKTRIFFAGNIDKLTELLVEIQAKNVSHSKNHAKILESFAKDYPVIEFELVDQNNLQNKYKIKARAKSIILHSGVQNVVGHYLTLNIDKNGKAILHDDIANKTLDELYFEFTREKISIDQFNKKTEQEKLIYIMDIYRYDPNLVLYEIIDKKLITSSLNEK